MPKRVTVSGVGDIDFPETMADHEIAGHIGEMLQLPREDRIRGSADLPLTRQGAADAKATGDVLKQVGGFDRIAASPKKRTMETAKLVSPDAYIKLDPKLEDVKYGDLEGKKTSEAIGTVNDHIVNMPDKPFDGVSKFSGEKGESFNQYKKRMIPAVLKVIQDQAKHPEEKVALVLNRRSMKTFQAWVDAGAKPDLSTNPATATSHEDGDVPNGSIWRISDKGLEPVQNVNDIGPGVYALRHFQTHWNS